MASICDAWTCWRASAALLVYLLSGRHHTHIWWARKTMQCNHRWLWHLLWSKECLQVTRAPRDLFCVNYGSWRGSFCSCQGTLCYRCYKAPSKTKFHRQLLENDHGVLWNKRRHKQVPSRARGDDMLCAPFQCDWCWFVNLNNREPSKGAISKWYEMELIYPTCQSRYLVITRNDNGWEDVNMYNKARGWANKMGVQMNMDSTIAAWPLGDGIGFSKTIVILRYSLERCINAKLHCQFDTIRKV